VALSTRRKTEAFSLSRVSRTEKAEKRNRLDTHQFPSVRKTGERSPSAAVFLKWELGRYFLAFGWRSGFTAAIECKSKAASAAEVPSMAAPRRGNTGYSCYFITGSALQKHIVIVLNTFIEHRASCFSSVIS